VGMRMRMMQVVGKKGSVLRIIWMRWMGFLGG